MQRRRLLVTFALLASACSFRGFGDFSGGQASGGATNDASVDAGVGADAGGGQDGGSDAAIPGPCGSFPPGTFCEPFEGDLQPAWTQRLRGSSSGVFVTPGETRSSNVLRAVAAGNSSDDRWAFVERALPDTVSHVRLSYWLYLDRLPSTGEVEVNHLQLLVPGGQHDFYLAFAANETYVGEQTDVGGGDVTTTPLALTVPPETWTHVSLEVKLDAPKKLVVAIDGKPATPPSLTVAFATPGRPTLTAGLNWLNAGSDRGEVLIDDLVFEILVP